MNNRQVLITGGAGFIGSNVANHLARRNEVVVVDDESLGTAEHLEDSVTFAEGSVLDEELPVDDMDAVIHLAALSSYDLVEQSPRQGVRVNVEGFVNTVEQARRAGCETIIYASSSSIYADHDDPVSEDWPVRAKSGYEASKLARERFGEYYEHHYGLSIAGLRLFSVYQGYAAGEAHKGGYANVIAQFADDMAAGQAPVLYGDGSQTRDFIHVDDVVRAFERAGDEQLVGTYNIGTGHACTFNEVVSMLNDALGTDIDPRYIDPPMPDEVYVERTWADPGRFEAATGWQAQIDLRQGIERVCEQYH